jgi:Na+/H+-dicarboxylate symporter
MIIKYIVGIIGFLFVWFVVAVIIGIVMVLVFPPPQGPFIAGIRLDWRNLPGTVLGFLAGIHSFRASIKGPKKREAEEHQ